MKTSIRINRTNYKTTPQDTNAKSTKTLEIPLTATLGETVYFPAPQQRLVDGDTSSLKLFCMGSQFFNRGIVTNIKTYGSELWFEIRSEHDLNSALPIASGVQEIFFRSFTEAEKAAELINQYSKTHKDWGKGWYETYLKLINPVYPYTLQLPAYPGQIWFVERPNVSHFVLIDGVYANISKKIIDIRYCGNTSKDGQFFDKNAYREEFTPNLPIQYSIVPN